MPWAGKGLFIQLWDKRLPPYWDSGMLGHPRKPLLSPAYPPFIAETWEGRGLAGPPVISIKRPWGLGGS